MYEVDRVDKPDSVPQGATDIYLGVLLPKRSSDSLRNAERGLALR